MANDINKELYEAVSTNKNLSQIKELVQNGADVNNTDYSILTCAVTNKNVQFDVVEFLIENNANINATDHDGVSILMSAIDSYSYSKNKEEKLEVIKLLIKKGAQINVKDKDGLSPIMYAFNNGLDTIVDLLLERGADKLDIDKERLINKEHFSMYNWPLFCDIYITFPQLNLRITISDYENDIRDEKCNESFSDLDLLEKKYIEEFNSIAEFDEDEESEWRDMDNEYLDEPFDIRTAIEEGMKEMLSKESFTKASSEQGKTEERKIDKIYHIIDDYKLSDKDISLFEDQFDIKIDNKRLKEVFTYIIEIYESDSDICLGVSKKGGLPHLPKDIQWPVHKKGEQYYFFTQLNITEFKQFDHYDLFPISGIIYLFITEEGSGKVLYSDAPVDKLNIREYPDDYNIPEYIQDELKEERFQFRPNFYFDFNFSNIYDIGAVLKKLPSDLINQINQGLGNKKLERVQTMDNNRLLGNPTDFQMDTQVIPSKHMLLLQYGYSDGNVYISLPAEDLKKGVFKNARIAYQGT